jgi:PAS domain S-box-containing protein
MAHILIVEDSPTQAERLRFILEEEGFQVESATTAEEALKLAEETRNDLILSDVVMPGQSGYELCRKIKSLPTARRTPVILLTTLDNPMAIIEGLDSGADNFLTKPYQTEELLHRINKLLETKAIRADGKVKLGVEVAFLGKRFTITSDKEQIVDLLISTFEDVVRANAELQENRAALAAAKLELEDRVALRTAELRDANARLNRIVQELRESEGRFRSIADTMPALLWMSDEIGQCVFVNKRWLDYTGRDFNAVLGHGFAESMHPDFQEKSLRLQREMVAERKSCVDEYQLRGKDGKYRRFLDTSVPRFAADGRYLGHVGVLIDIEERHQLEQQLRQSQKMEAVGQLTGGIAHDFNNLLTVIIGHIELLGTAPDLDGTRRHQIETIDRAATRASELTRRLLAFGRRQPLEPRKVEMNRLVSNVEAMLQRTLGESIEIECVLAGGLWPCFADPAQIEAAILNMAVNARDAMPNGGKLTIETANTRLSEDYSAVNDDVGPGQYVMLAVTDTGTGMAPEVQARAFEPFFTTKEVGKGTGLGLSMIYGFVKQSGGHIKIYSEIGHGTVIKIYLPRAKPEDQQATSASLQDSGAPPGGTETILVVEDDPMVREYVVGQLRSLGYTIIEAVNGPNAIAALDSAPHVDLLFTDIVMPGGMSGRELADEVRRRYPQLKILFTSGYTENAVVHHGRLDPGVDLLNKPFAKRALAAKVRTVLDRQS